MPWIPDNKPFTRDTKTWFCKGCQRRTAVEHNPIWIAAGMPHQWEGNMSWDGHWLARCAVCHRQHYGNTVYNCPECGCLDHETIERGKVIHRPDLAYEFGGDPLEWDETVRCDECENIFFFTNGTH